MEEAQIISHSRSREGRRSWDESSYLAVRCWRDGLARPLVELLDRVGMSPNAVSTLGVALAATTFLSLPTHRTLALAAFLGALVCDGLDGALARFQGRTSPRGKLFDQTCDTLTFLTLLGSMATHGLVSWPAAVLAAALAPALLLVGFAIYRQRDLLAWRAQPRAGFFAHLPKAIFYGALLLELVGSGWGGEFLQRALESSNVLAVGCVLWLLVRWTVGRFGGLVTGR